MAKKIILYNLKDSVTDAEYQEYCTKNKGPFLKGLPSCKAFTLVRIASSKSGVVPYRYVGVVDLTSTSDWDRDAASAAFQAFQKEWLPKVSDFSIMTGEEVFEA